MTWTSEDENGGTDAPRDPYLPVGRKPRRDDEFEMTVQRLDARGGAEGRWDRYRVRLRRGVPGQRVHAQVNRRRRDQIEARVLRVVAAGADEVTARCPHFGSCGGCSFQDLAYARQLQELHRLASEELAAVQPARVAPVIGADRTWAYRNKMDFTFSNRRWIEPDEPAGVDASFALGLHRPGKYRKVIDVSRCEIQFEEGNAIVDTARGLAREHGLEPWDVEAHTGLLRHLMLRKGRHTGEIMVNLVTSEEAPERVGPYAAGLVERHPEVTTFVQNINTRPASVAEGEYERVLHGPGVIHEELRGVRFAISANSFFQTNTLQAERLLDVIADHAGLGGDETVYDLYCGVGTIALHLARQAKRVYGFEMVEAAVADARRNAELNGITNCRFEAGDLARTLAPAVETREAAPQPAVCVVDPPRSGMHKTVVAALRALAPSRIVYVSCNPAAAARDLEPFVEAGYRVSMVQPLDLFPHTPHLECVIRVDRIAADRSGDRFGSWGAALARKD